MARKDELVIQEVSGETLVYDLKSHEAHCLNQTAALVWKHCDGRLTVAQVMERLERELKSPVSQEVVWLALDQLEKSDLLEKGARPLAGYAPVSRRALIRSLGIATAVAVPLVTSIVAPTAAQTGSKCGGVGASCGGMNPECCKGLVCDGSCFDPAG
ncbi:MAG TPA: PqqD family protein [Pyrinomonadaceae bacterium]|jgi:hypothetical protein|nr:PqqD family protein [Pyrinomonadaceae bacterium]